MAQKSTHYTAKSVQKLTLREAIRKRPGMYVFQTNHRGFTGILKNLISGIFTEKKADEAILNFKSNSVFEITFSGFKKPIEGNTPNLDTMVWNSFRCHFQLLNALCQHFEFELLNQSNSTLIKQQYREGIFEKGELNNKPLEASILKIKFTLDPTIWDASENWNLQYIISQIQEYSYLFKGKKITLLYLINSEPCKVILNFQSGLNDLLEIEKLKGLGGTFLDTYWEAQINDIWIEVAFAFRSYSVDPPYLKSFVNDFETTENGTHVEALLKGLTYGVMKFFQKNELTQMYKISEKGMMDGLLLLMNIRYEQAVFTGCVKNKLGNPEIIEPIANYVSNMFVQKIEKEEKGREELIQRFKIETYANY